ncbi:lysophospholipid acyltransferase family protein [Acinetobacter puyangensis]|uniref:KDO2-lipid IV(A) lauroyltransferase n=1 Tax=Acinetobacter puyangensis TaxID=1096779 RepID=A0A240E5Z1_9GAMM|nr:lysophospholipid acyltransferase family protein [Acinetobacter puyangensis]SNX43295.1 KDO2-lipid IV(A) lauroyltransferase [Acinetobacter puyangensis]
MQILKLFRYLPLTVIQASARMAAWFINQKPSTGMFWKTSINLKLAYPDLTDQQRQQLAKESVTKQCLSYAESLKCWAMPPEWSIEQIKVVHHLEVFKNALNDLHGVLIIVPHLGTWEMMNAWIHQYGIPTIMYKPIKDQSINHFVLQARERLNATLVPTNANGVKTLFKNLKQGGFSIILPDHVPHPSGGVIVPFFGINCLTSTLASKMAQKTHCRLIGLSCIRRNNDDGFEVYCDDLNDPKLYDTDIEIATTALNQAIEKMIKRFPAEYMWGYKRFRGNPELKNIYKIN